MVCDVCVRAGHCALIYLFLFVDLSKDYKRFVAKFGDASAKYVDSRCVDPALRESITQDVLDQMAEWGAMQALTRKEGKEKKAQVKEEKKTQRKAKIAEAKQKEKDIKKGNQKNKTEKQKPVRGGARKKVARKKKNSSSEASSDEDKGVGLGAMPRQDSHKMLALLPSSRHRAIPENECEFSYKELTCRDYVAVLGRNIRSGRIEPWIGRVDDIDDTITCGLTVRYLVPEVRDRPIGRWNYSKDSKGGAEMDQLACDQIIAVIDSSTFINDWMMSREEWNVLLAKAKEEMSSEE